MTGKKKIIFLFIALLFFASQTVFAKSDRQVFIGSFVDTSNHKIKEALDFLLDYYKATSNLDSINYRAYFTAQRCDDYKIPDPLIHAIASEGNTYEMYSAATIFYAKQFPDYILIKTLFLWKTDSVNFNPSAITNHYIHHNEKGYYFLTEMEQHADAYRTVQNANIEYVFPKAISFDKNKSDSLIASLRRFEKEWNFKPIPHIRYVFANTKEELAKMKGLDYLVLMDENTPSGYSDDESNTVYCQGKGENYLHEILHLYLNPFYQKSPVNHGLVYYWGGGIMGSYTQMIHRLDDYLRKYPETDLTDYDKLISKDRLLHIDHAINAMLCKRVYEKEGVKGLKRLLSYPDLESLYLKEYKLSKNERNEFLRKMIAKESAAAK